MARLKKRWWVISLILAETIFGFSFLFTKIALDTLTLEQLIASRFVIAASFLTFLWVIGAIKLHMTWKKLWGLMPIALLMPILYFVFETLGVQRTSSSEAGVMMALYPVVTIIVSWAMGMERLSLKRWLAIAVSVGGVVLITLARGINGDSSIMGFVYLALAILSGAFYTVFSRKASNKATPEETTYVMMMTGAVGFTGYMVIRSMAVGQFDTVLQGIGSAPVIVSILYLGVLSSVATFFIMNKALSHLEPSKVTVYANITPLVALFAGVIFLHENILPMQYVGTVLVIGGVYAAVRLEIAESRFMKIESETSDPALEVGVADGEAQHHEHTQVDHSIP